MIDVDTSVTPQDAPMIATLRAKQALVVDDSAAQRLVLAKNLQRWGYQVTQAASGDAAMDLCATGRFDLILSDWMMPGMNGLDFCRAFRALDQESYSYFILLTSKNDKSAVAEGLNVGADDFLSKPVSTPELRARIRAGERLLAMERQVKARNEELQAALRTLQALYDAVDRDLMEARKLQQSLIRDRFHDFGGSQLSAIAAFFGPCRGGHGRHISDQRAANRHLFAGPCRAMAWQRRCWGPGSAACSAVHSRKNIALSRNYMTGQMEAVAPHDVAARMNTLMLQEIDTEAYLTVAYADLDLTTGRLVMVQAGHPHPVIQRLDGDGGIFWAKAGLPIGLIEGAQYSSFEAELRPGDRLFLYSDGITELRRWHGL